MTYCSVHVGFMRESSPEDPGSWMGDIIMTAERKGAMAS